MNIVRYEVLYGIKLRNLFICVMSLMLCGCQSNTKVTKKQSEDKQDENKPRKVFLLIGQSNMSGRGSLNEVPEIVNPNVYMFRDGAWKTAKEPLHNDKPSAGAGLGMSFADKLQKELDCEIGLVPCAFGGTAINLWQPNQDLYKASVKNTLNALEGNDYVLSGILWHQGEGDAYTAAQVNSYNGKFIEMVTNLKRELNAEDVPVFLGEIFHGLVKSEFPYADALNESLRKLSEENENIYLVTAEDLKCYSDNLHFTSESLRIFGIRYAEAYLERCVSE